MTQAIELTRIFKHGTIRLPDPDPTLSPEKVKDLYSVNYPHLKSAIIENLDNPTVEGNSVVYEFKPAPVKTKG